MKKFKTVTLVLIVLISVLIMIFSSCATRKKCETYSGTDVKYRDFNKCSKADFESINGKIFKPNRRHLK